MAARVLHARGAASAGGLLQRAAPCSLLPGLRGLTSSSQRPREDSWLKSLFVRKVDPRKDAHSNLLAKRETSSLYKIQFHNVKPECLEAYNKICQEVLPKIHEDKHYPCTLVGTWNTWYGEQDQAVHLWRYEGGYPALTEVMNKLRENQEFLHFRKARSNMLLSRKNQLLLEFSFWNEPVPRPGPNIYELRSYQLRPGTMIEWGNYWARAIRFRQDGDEAVGGFFSQIGQLYMVHHLWAYKDLQTREDIRNAAWHKHGWEELVYYTDQTPQSQIQRAPSVQATPCGWQASRATASQASAYPGEDLLQLMHPGCWQSRGSWQHPSQTRPARSCPEHSTASSPNAAKRLLGELPGSFHNEEQPGNKRLLVGDLI